MRSFSIIASAVCIVMTMAHSSYCPGAIPTPESDAGCLTFDLDSYTMCVQRFDTCEPVSSCAQLLWDAGHAVCFDSCELTFTMGDSGRPVCITDTCGQQVQGCEEQLRGYCSDAVFCFSDCVEDGGTPASDYFTGDPVCSVGDNAGKSPCDDGAFTCAVATAQGATTAPSSAPTSAPASAPTCA